MSKDEIKVEGAVIPKCHEIAEVVNHMDTEIPSLRDKDDEQDTKVISTEYETGQQFDTTLLRQGKVPVVFWSTSNRPEPVQMVIYLTRKQKEFIDVYVRMGNRSAAAKKVGITAMTAYAWFNSGRFFDYYKQCLVNYTRANMLTKDYLDAKLLNTLEDKQITLDQKIKLLQLGYSRFNKVSPKTKDGNVRLEINMADHPTVKGIEGAIEAQIEQEQTGGDSGED